MLESFDISTGWAVSWGDGRTGLVAVITATATLTQSTATESSYNLVGTIEYSSFEIGTPLVGDSTVQYSSLAIGTQDWTTFPPVSITSLTNAPVLPTALGGGTAAVGDLVLQLRGIASKTSSSSVQFWSSGGGVFLTITDAPTTTPTTVNFSTTFTVPTPSTYPFTILKEYGSGNIQLPSVITTTQWYKRGDGYGIIEEAPSTDYRPGAVYNGSSLLSCNRSGGARKIYGPEGWLDMASDGSTPPSIRNTTALVPQVKTGQE